MALILEQGVAIAVALHFLLILIMAETQVGSSLAVILLGVLLIGLLTLPSALLMLLLLDGVR